MQISTSSAVSVVTLATSSANSFATTAQALADDDFSDEDDNEDNVDDEDDEDEDDEDEDDEDEDDNEDDEDEDDNEDNEDDEDDEDEDDYEDEDAMDDDDEDEDEDEGGQSRKRARGSRSASPARREVRTSFLSRLPPHSLPLTKLPPPSLPLCFAEGGQQQPRRCTQLAEVPTLEAGGTHRGGNRPGSLLGETRRRRRDRVWQRLGGRAQVLRHSGQAEGDVACSDHVAAFSVTFCQVLYL
jgi:hypothetical protein